MPDSPQRIYDAEQNFEISCFWDSGFIWWLGAPVNGYKAYGQADTYEDAVRQLLEAFDRQGDD